MFKLPNPFRKQGQQIGPDGCTNAMCDYYTSEQMLQFRRDALWEAAQLVKAIESDRHDWEDWPTDSREAFHKLKEQIK